MHLNIQSLFVLSLHMLVATRNFTELNFWIDELLWNILTQILQGKQYYFREFLLTSWTNNTLTNIQSTYIIWLRSHGYEHHFPYKLSTRKMAISKLKGDFCKLSFLEIRAYISLQQWFSILMAYQLRSFFKKCWCGGPTTKQLNQNLWADNQASVVSFCSPRDSDV